MSTLSLPTYMRAPAVVRPARWFWRRWYGAFLARRQRQADRVILQCLRDNRVRCDETFRVELERRLLGQ
jgi:hypothetical protein